jgi:iron complex outermembrane receptor protein
MKHAALIMGLCSLFALTEGVAQDCHLALRGHVMELETDEPLSFATVFVKEIGRGAVTDEHGWFSIADLCEKTAYTIEIRHVECAHFVQIVQLTENAQMDFHVAHHAILAEVVIREKALPPPVLQAESTVGKLDLDVSQGLNLAETLKKLPGVASLSTGATIAKPVIHGLHSNRIAVVTNGVTLEGQQWGSEHAPEVDPFTAGRITVVKGASGLRYGVGAMGGAVVLEPAPLRSEPGLGGWLSLGAFSNGMGGVASGAADWKAKGTSFAMRVQGTLKKSGNLHAPDYFLGNTGSSEANLSFLASWQKGGWGHELALTHFSQQIGILKASHISDTASLRLAIRSETPLFNDDRFTWTIARPSQDIQHNLLKYKILRRFSERWKGSLQYAWQYNNRLEFDSHPPKSDPQDLERKPQQSFQIWTNMLDAALEHMPIGHWQGGVGFQGIHQLNYVGKGGSIPDYQLFGGALWAVERWRRYPTPWELEVGLRYDFRHAEVSTLGTLQNLEERLFFQNLSGGLGLSCHFSKKLSATLHSGLAWRPPHLNELFARGVHHGAATYERGDPGLLPEKAWNSNLSFQYKNQKKEVSITVSRNRISDFIFIQSLDSVVITVRGPFPFYQYAQAPAAVLQGLDAALEWPLAQGLAVVGRASLLRAWRRKGEGLGRDWLPLMPVDRFHYGLSWSADKKGRPAAYARLMATTALRQARVPSDGLLKEAPAGFTTWQLDLGKTLQWRLGKRDLPIEIGLSAQNLTNVRYREYLNFFRFYADEPGLNIGLRCKATF